MFPLFTTIYHATVAKHEEDLKKDKRIELCQLIDGVDQEGNDLIFAIIQQYYQEIDIDKSKHNRNGYAYSPKNYKKGLKYDMSSLPLGLLHMLQYFIDLHIKKLDEDKKRNEENCKMSHKNFTNQLSISLPEKSMEWFLHYLRKKYIGTRSLQDVSYTCTQFNPSVKYKYVPDKKMTEPPKSLYNTFIICHDNENKILDILFFLKK